MNPYEFDHQSPVCPSSDCDCDGCTVRCAGCGDPVGEWTGATGVQGISQRAYCRQCAELATLALSDAIALLLGPVHGVAVWSHGAALAQPRINAALHLTRPASRASRHRATSWPTSIEVA